MAVVNLSDASIKTGGKRTTFWDQVTYANAGLQLISTQSLLGVSNVTFDNVFSDDYIQYKIVTSATGTTLAGINFQFRTNGTTYTSANYNWQKIIANVSAVSGGRSTGQTNWQNALGAVDNAKSYVMQLEILNPFQSTYTSGINHHSYSDQAVAEWRSFGTSVTNSFDGFYGYTSGGTITGSISVYGYYKGA